MSVFGVTSYASIDEVWGSPAFAPSIENIHKSTGYQKEVLNTAEQVVKESDDAMCARHVNAVYKRDGLVGVRRIVDPVIIRELQTQAVRRFATNNSSMLSQDELMLILLGLLVIVFAMEQ